MTAVPVEPQPWPWRRWLGMVALIFAVQLGLIFWLGSTAPIQPRHPAAAFTLRYAGKASSEMRALNDPTLFTLAHPQQSSDLAPVRTAPPELHSFQWSAPTNHLILALDQLGSIFNRLVETSDFRAPELLVEPDAAPTLPQLVLPVLPAARSTLQLDGALAQRQLLAPLELKSQTNQEILTNTVVQMGVDAEGLPVSVTLLSSSGSPTADQYGLDEAWAARFQPAKNGPPGAALGPTAQMSWGRLIFQWHTVPAPPAAAPNISP